VRTQLSRDRVDERRAEDDRDGDRFGEQKDGDRERHGEVDVASDPVGLVGTDGRKLQTDREPEELREQDQPEEGEQDRLLGGDDEEPVRDEKVHKNGRSETVQDPPPDPVSEGEVPSEPLPEPAPELSALVEPEIHRAGPRTSEYEG